MITVASWNVNSLRARLPQVLRYLEERAPDVLCLQETRLSEAAFPRPAFADLGYESATAGDGGYAGVAIVSRRRIEETVSGIRGFDEPRAPGRRVACRVDAGWIDTVYVPTRTAIGKVEFLDALRKDHDERFKDAVPAVLAGDFNICFDERDYASPTMISQADVHPRRPEDHAFRRLVDGRWIDCLRRLSDEHGPFSWFPLTPWALRRNYGMRLDYVWASPPLADELVEVVHDREPRSWPRPSDHLPVLARFDA